MSDIRYKRVLLKLSGEALMGDGQYGIDPKVTDHLAKQVKELLAVGHEVGVVVGGGNIFRGMAGAAGGLHGHAGNRYERACSAGCLRA